MLTQQNASGWLMYYHDLREFIDTQNGICSFDSPEALRYLEFLVTLPANTEEWRKRSPFANNIFDYTRSQELYFEGRIVLANFSFTDPLSWLGRYATFMTDDVTLIGYATKNPEIPYSGIISVPVDVLTINAASDQPDLAWDFVKYLILQGEVYPCGATVLKSVYDRLAAEKIGMTFAYYADGFMTSFLVTEDTPIEEADPFPDRPGLRVVFTEQEAEELRELFDQIGASYLSGLAEDVSDIVNEELSAMTAGAASPETCAKHIQSRVSIWLAEHK